MKIVQLLLSFSILVFIHELGHFWMARLFGARVEKFYLFFNPFFSLFKWRSPKSGTIYGLGWLPLGGYCQIAGMVDESMDAEGLKEEPKPDEFRSKKAWQRLLIMAGGILFNLVLACLIYVGVAMAWGKGYLPSSEASAGYKFSSIAHEVGFRDGDIILSADGDRELNALSRTFAGTLLEAKEVEVLRAGDTLTITMPNNLVERLLESEQSFFASLRIPFVVAETMRASTEEAGVRGGDTFLSIGGVSVVGLEETMLALQAHKGEQVNCLVRHEDGTQEEVRVEIDAEGKIGVQLKDPTQIYPVEYRSYGAIEAIGAGFAQAYDTLTNYVTSLKYLFTKAGAKSVGGLGSVAQLFPSSFDWQNFWTITAFLSIMLAVMNLLPIPALDGGHILFLLIEMITGKKLSDKVMMYIQAGGMILIVLLMVYANANDIYRFWIK